MYALVEDSSITKIIKNPKSMVIGDVTYPAKIFELWSGSELNAIGIYEIETDTTNFKDEQYYINTNSTFNFADNKVTETWGTATAKELDDSNAVDSDGNNILDDDGNQIIISGLKTLKKNTVKKQASSLLTPTDWYVIKAQEVSDYSVPSNVSTYRSNVRTKSNEMETQIDACSTVDELKALYEYTRQDDGTYTRPLAEFPKEI